ncbi:MAG: MiaB/RimO family radical SAM methylthiotransferase [Lachnospiraceae bacterium]
MRKKAALHNLGCKVNAYETEARAAAAGGRQGARLCRLSREQMFCVINTCTATACADRKSRQMLHRARKMNPDAVVVATGCYVETADGAAKGIRRLTSCSAITGRENCSPCWESMRSTVGKREYKEAFTDKIDINHTKEYENLQISRSEARTRADIKVQDGCQSVLHILYYSVCAWTVRSRTMDDVLNEVSMLAGSGCQEVVLTGIHLSSYGVDLGTSLIELIQAVHEVDGITRIRLGSLEPGIVTPEFAHTLSALPKVCPHFHLSLQSGCDTVLKRMNRRYTSDEFEKKCQILREAFDQPALTTDVIVGFPGETETEYATTVDFLTRVGLYETHIFKYSRRQGTKAAVMPDQIPEPVKGVRSDRLIALGEENRKRFEQSWIGKRAEVLFEEQTMD